MIGAVVPERLNVRSMPLTTSSVLGVLSADKVIHGEAEINGWWQIRYAETIGFVHASYLKPVNELSRLSGTVNTPLLNVRAAPSVSAPCLAALHQGASVKTLAFLEGWLEIEFNQLTAYVASSFVDLVYSASGYYGIVTAELLNVRSAPMLTANLFGQLAKGSKIWVEGTIQGWNQIRFNGNRGYVSSTYVDTETPPRIKSPVPLADRESDNAEPIPKRSDDQLLSALSPSILLSVTGEGAQRAVANTWNRFGALLTGLCTEKQVSTGAAVAVLCVESSGKGFEQNNSDRMIIRFENHKFWRYWGKYHAVQYRQHFRYRSDKVWLGHEWRKRPDHAWQSFHGHQSSEWDVFEFARLLNEEAALLSISMGAPQIMGFNFERVGFQSVVEMFDAFSSHIQYQIRGLFDYFSPPMLRYLRHEEFIAFAGMYNGSGQKEIYGERISQHYHTFNKLMPNQNS